MTRKRTIGTRAALGGLTAAAALITATQAAKADEVSGSEGQSAASPAAPRPAGAINPGAGVPYLRRRLRAGHRADDGRQLPALLPDARHRHLDPGRRRNPLGLVLFQRRQPERHSPNTTPASTARPRLSRSTSRVRRRRRGAATSSSISPRQSKLSFETRTPTAWGEARTFIEFDWAGQSGGHDPSCAVSDNLIPACASPTPRSAAAGRPGELELLRSRRQHRDDLDFGGLVGDPGFARPAGPLHDAAGDLGPVGRFLGIGRSARDRYDLSRAQITFAVLWPVGPARIWLVGNLIPNAAGTGLSSQPGLRYQTR